MVSFIAPRLRQIASLCVFLLITGHASFIDGLHVTTSRKTSTWPFAPPPEVHEGGNPKIKLPKTQDWLAKSKLDPKYDVDAHPLKGKYDATEAEVAAEQAHEHADIDHPDAHIAVAR
ncbi:unnamed protein product [Amoebophrya sp. A25]|nr:unnamed protein product [Amoebophrya sp. A25]|eukprot:GSA25T00014832001.1